MTIATQPFGRSGHMSTRTLFGAAALGHVTQEEADRTLEVLLQYGVNHIDVAASYGDAELRIAPWLARYRSQFYVATKTDARTAHEAKKQGLIRAVGVTGHGLQIAATHRRSLERFDFDSVLLPYNYITMQSPYYAENFNALVATCQQRNVAVQTIKSIAYKPWMGRAHTRTTWYEPLEEQKDIDL